MCAADGGDTVQVQGAPPDVTALNATSSYRSYHRLTEQPEIVPLGLSRMCIYPSPQMLEAAKMETGPHFFASVHYYANEPAFSAIMGRLEAFPVGSVLVKEKLEQVQAQGIPHINEPGTAVGGMIKRASGYDPANGDWEYFYSSPGNFATGHLQTAWPAMPAPTRKIMFSGCVRLLRQRVVSRAGR